MPDAALVLRVARADQGSIEAEERGEIARVLSGFDFGEDVVGLPFEVAPHPDPSVLGWTLRLYWGEGLDDLVFDGTSFRLATYATCEIDGEEWSFVDLSDDIDDPDAKFEALLARDATLARQVLPELQRLLGDDVRLEIRAECW